MKLIIHSKTSPVTSVCAKFAGPRPQAGNREDRLANEAFAGPAGLAMIYENYIGSYC